MSGKRQHPYRRFGRETFSAVALTLFSVPAFVFSVFLTVLKFRTGYRCDGFMQNVCSSGCDVALSDPWSVVLGLPISAYGTAFYLVLLMFAFALGLWPLRFAAAARLPVLLLGVAGLAVSVLLGAYAWFGLGIWCIYCTILYIANVGIFLAARLLNPEGLLRGLRNGVRRFDLLCGTVCWAALSALVAGVVLQTRIYAHHAAAALHDRLQYTNLSCGEQRLRELPETALKLASEGEPEVIVALFFDVACSHCRREFEFWRRYQQEHRDFLQVELFHFSADAACGPMDSPFLQANQSCNGALALECLNSLAEGDPLDHMARLLALQDRQSPYFSIENLQSLADQLGVKNLVECINEPETLRRVRQHISFGINAKLNAPPSSLIIPARRGKPFGRALRLRGGGKAVEYIDAKIQEARARSREDE